MRSLATRLDQRASRGASSAFSFNYRDSTVIVIECSRPKPIISMWFEGACFWRWTTIAMLMPQLRIAVANLSQWKCLHWIFASP